MGPAAGDLEDVLMRFNRNLRTYGVRVVLAGIEGGLVSVRVDRPLGVGLCSSGCDIPLPALLLALERGLASVPGVEELRWTAGAEPP